jgi:hypothetical protein
VPGLIKATRFNTWAGRLAHLRERRHRDAVYDAGLGWLRSIVVTKGEGQHPALRPRLRVRLERKDRHNHRVGAGIAPRQLVLRVRPPRMLAGLPMASIGWPQPARPASRKFPLTCGRVGCAMRSCTPSARTHRTVCDAPERISAAPSRLCCATRYGRGGAIARSLMPRRRPQGGRPRPPRPHRGIPQ